MVRHRSNKRIFCTQGEPLHARFCYCLTLRYLLNHEIYDCMLMTFADPHGISSRYRSQSFGSSAETRIRRKVCLMLGWCTLSLSKVFRVLDSFVSILISIHDIEKRNTLRAIQWIILIDEEYHCWKEYTNAKERNWVKRGWTSLRYY